jgi:hypothetical protein
VDIEQYKNDTLIINYVGYARKEIPVADLKLNKPIVLEVSEYIIMGLFVAIEKNPLADEQGGYNDLTPWFERHKTRRINRGK